jgi:hypothetical protein
MKSTKAAKIIKMLNAGESVTFIKRMLGVSESYIYLVKKMLTEGVEAEVKNDDDVVRPRVVGPHEVKRVTKAEADALVEAAAALKEACTFTPNKEQVDTILDVRGTNYGTFLSLSQVTQRLKAVAHNFAGQNNKTFDADQAEALDMIFTKVGRILNGDSNHIDSWIDIAGYATLVADRLQGKAR